MIGWAQYNLEEFGLALGPGLAVLQNTATKAIGPAGNVNAFFSHYACGKGYGFHVNAGFAAMFPIAGEGEKLLGNGILGQTTLQFAALDVAVLGKLRIHEYHRPREWAVFLGPRLQVPFLARCSSASFSGPLKNFTNSVYRVWPGIELSVQFRRPIGKKKSMFIHPGAAYFFLPAFNSFSGNARPLYLFLNLGYALWDQRG